MHSSLRSRYVANHNLASRLHTLYATAMSASPRTFSVFAFGAFSFSLFLRRSPFTGVPATFSVQLFFALSRSFTLKCVFFPCCSSFARQSHRRVHVEQVEESDALQRFFEKVPQKKRTRKHTATTRANRVGVCINNDTQSQCKAKTNTERTPSTTLTKELCRRPPPRQLQQRKKIDFIYKTYQFDLDYVCKIACGVNPGTCVPHRLGTVRFIICSLFDTFSRLPFARFKAKRINSETCQSLLFASEEKKIQQRKSSGLGTPSFISIAFIHSLSAEAVAGIFDGLFLFVTLSHRFNLANAVALIYEKK